MHNRDNVLLFFSSIYALVYIYKCVYKDYIQLASSLERSIGSFNFYSTALSAFKYKRNEVNGAEASLYMCRCRRRRCGVYVHKPN